MTPVDSISENSKSSQSKSTGSKKKKGADKRNFFQGKQANSQLAVSNLPTVTNPNSNGNTPGYSKKQPLGGSMRMNDSTIVKPIDVGFIDARE